MDSLSYPRRLLDFNRKINILFVIERVFWRYLPNFSLIRHRWWWEKQPNVGFVISSIEFLSWLDWLINNADLPTFTWENDLRIFALLLRHDVNQSFTSLFCPICITVIYVVVWIKNTNFLALCFIQRTLSWLSFSDLLKRLPTVAACRRCLTTDLTTKHNLFRAKLGARDSRTTNIYFPPVRN